MSSFRSDAYVFTERYTEMGDDDSGVPVYCDCGDLIGYGPTGDKPICWDCKQDG